MTQERIKQFFQAVCVVNDLDETMDNWKRMVEFNEASIKTGKSDEKAECTYKGKKINCPIKYATFDLGGIEMMMVEPLNKKGGDPYSDSLIEKGQGFHHLGIHPENYEELLKHFGAKGHEPVFKTTLEDGTPFMLYNFENEVGMSIAPWEKMSGPCGR